MKKLFLIIGIFMAAIAANAQDWCPGNIFVNGDIETPSSPNLIPGGDQNISDALGFHPIWTNNSLADWRSEDEDINNSDLMSPADGAWAGFWITTWPTAGLGEREGLFNELSTVLNPGQTYTFSFDLAVMYQGAGELSKLAVYAINNPSGNPSSLNMVDVNTPSNMELFGVNNTYFIGEILIDSQFNTIGEKINQALTFTPDIPVTHLLITRAENTAPKFYGKRYVGVDNFCLHLDEPVPDPTEDAAYCCIDENLKPILENGNFEFGNVGFNSAYAYQDNIAANSVYPGSYGIVNSSQANIVSPNWNVQDHSYCVDNSTYANNSMFMVVNGKTQQAIGSYSTIYRQYITPEMNTSYKLCLNLKNLHQCTFDIKPQIRVRISSVTWDSDSPYHGEWIEINTSGDPCDWYNFEACFRFERLSRPMQVVIDLKEDGIGDGNDLAIDDISFTKKLGNDNFGFYHDYFNTSNGPVATASYGQPGTSDDYIVENADCNTRNNYEWIVYQTTELPDDDEMPSEVPGTYAWSNGVSGHNDQNGQTLTWGLTHDFENYVFENNKFYCIALIAPSCCESCYEDMVRFHIVGTSKNRVVKQEIEVTPEIREELKKLSESKGNTKASVSNIGLSIDKINISPNPTKNTFNVSLTQSFSGEATVTDISGKTIVVRSIADEQSFDIDMSSFSKGIYLLKMTNENGMVIKRIVKE